MRFNRFIFEMTAIALPIFVTLSTQQAMAQKSCAVVHSRISIYKESFLPMKELSESTIKFIEDLKSNPRTIETQQLTLEIKRLENLADNYLRAAGIEFHKVPVNIQINNLKNTPKFDLTYHLYVIYGTRNGDEISRLLFGAGKNPKITNYSPYFALDLLYNYRNESVAKFVAKSGGIHFGPKALSYSAFGQSNVIRHEIQHYFEQVKIYKGQQTLARISLFQNEPVSKKSYGEYLALDELETYIRELRQLLNQNQMHSIDSKVFAVTKSDGEIQKMQNLRHLFRTDRFNLMNQILNDSKRMIELLENRIKKGSWDSIHQTEQSDPLLVSFLFLNEQPYAKVEIDLTSILQAEQRQNPTAIKTALSEILEWSKTRIAEIEKEILSLSERTL